MERGRDAPVADETNPTPPTSRQDNADTGRLQAFSDGVFAVAITLLVFNIATPHVRQGRLTQALLDQWPSYAGYVVSFLTIGIIWVNHHGTFRHIVRTDRPLLFINLLLLMTVSFIPFPTNLLSQYIQGGGTNASVAAFVYAATMTAMSIAFSGLWFYAVQRGLLHSDHVDRRRARASVPRFGFGLLLYVSAMALALVSPMLDLALFALLALFYVFDQQAV
jgi:uncharacterized membrane protein